MDTILLVVQVFLALGIIGLVLIQRSESDGFGMGSGSGFGVLSGRAKANLLTRATATLAALFMINSLLLTILTTRSSGTSLIDTLPDTVPALETSAPVDTLPDSAETEKDEGKNKEEAPAPVVPRAE